MRRAAIAGLVLLLALLAGCGEPNSDGGGADPAEPQDPETPVSSTPDPGGGGGAADDPEAMRVTAQEGLVDVQARRYERAEVADSGEALDIYFWDGIEECGGVDHAHLTYEAKTVTVNLFTGRNPEAEICTEQAVFKVFRVELAEPLEGRKLVDGAR